MSETEQKRETKSSDSIYYWGVHIIKDMGEEADIQRMQEIASEIEELSKEMRTLVLKYSTKNRQSTTNQKWGKACDRL